MEDWQGCLSPDCQTALQNARARVTRRGGHAVTLEDLLLAMLDDIPELCRFLQRQGVDLDELTRTIQCEQPIVTEVASDNLLSSQLVYWLDRAREVTGAVWLEWPELLQTLIQSSDRLQEKAYVAVLEAVSHWPVAMTDPMGDGHAGSSDDDRPVVMADARWLQLVDDVSVRLSANPPALVWIRGERGSGKSSLLRSLVSALPGGAVEVNLRREAEVLASEQSVMPTLVLDNVSPADLITFMSSEFSVARELVTGFTGSVLLVGPDSPASDNAVEQLQQILGRSLQAFNMPPCSISQKQAILTAHQPIIEKRWRIELAPGLVEYAAANRHPSVASPGAMLNWLESAAARLHLFAERGPMEAAALAGQADSLRRQSLLALARHQAIDGFEHSVEAIDARQDAFEASWRERKREGSLRILKTADLQAELDRRVAASSRSGQYRIDKNQTGEFGLA